MKSKTRNMILMILFFLLVIPLLIAYFSADLTKEQNTAIIPIFGLPSYIHQIFFYLIWPTFGSLLFIYIFPHVGIPIYLGIKKPFHSRYENGYIDIGEKQYNLKKFIFRNVNVFLLSIGFNTSLLSSGLIDQNSLVTIFSLATLQSQNMVVQYSMDGFLGFTSMLMPISIGIWSISWTLEDAGIIHFKLPEENLKSLFEIEPVHFKYKGFIKGYAGVTAFVYYISAIIYYLTYHPNNLVEILLLSIAGFLYLIFCIPAYIIYLKIGNKHFRKNLKTYRTITRKEFDS